LCLPAESGKAGAIQTFIGDRRQKMDEEKIKPIWPDELKDYINRAQEKNYLLVDVRQPQEYEEEHIPGAELIPLHLIMAGHARLPRDKELVFYCSHGMRSRAAAQNCADTGEFSKPIYSLMGGLSAWGGAWCRIFQKSHFFKALKPFRNG
jgi:rhodanese-related sulfurtransferase